MIVNILCGLMTSLDSHIDVKTFTEWGATGASLTDALKLAKRLEVMHLCPWQILGILLKCSAPNKTKTHLYTSLFCDVWKLQI